MKLALIPAGMFLMGSPVEENGRDNDDEPQVAVQITKPFLIGVHEVTQAQYMRVMGDNPSHFSAGKPGSAVVACNHTFQFPVEYVSWHDAVDFCRRLTELPEEKAAGRVYRLPSEAEWEYACRAGSAGPFHFGANLDGTQACCDGSSPYGMKSRGAESPQYPTAVGSYEANDFGLHDMHGNVSEWCEDWYAPVRYEQHRQWSQNHGDQPCPDPKGPPDGKYRVIRGGSWQDLPEFNRSACRQAQQPAERTYEIGFRVVASQPAVRPEA